MLAFDVEEVVAARDRSVHTYEDLIASASLSVGLAIWPAGSVDTQQPHTEDEVYHVISGSGAISVGDEERRVGPGSVVFVATGVEHRFHDIDEELRVLVFWAPPHNSRR